MKYIWNNRKKNNNCGFTLVELLVAMGVFAIVMAQVGAIVLNCSKLYRKGVDHVDLQTESQRVIQLTEELMIDATGSISVNDSAYAGSNDIHIVTTNIDGVEYQYDIYLKKDNVADEKGKLYLKKTDLTNGVDNADDVMADNVKSISLNMANYSTDDRVSLCISMKSDEYTYESMAIKDIYLRNDIGSGSKDGDGSVATGNYNLDVRRYEVYDLGSLYGNEYVYELDTTVADSKYYNLDATKSTIECGHSLRTSLGQKSSCVVKAYLKTDALKTSPAFTIACNTQKVRVALGDEGSGKGSAIAYGDSSTSNLASTSFADVIGITLNPARCESELHLFFRGKDITDKGKQTEGTTVNYSPNYEGEWCKLTKFGYAYDPQSEAYFLKLHGFDLSQNKDFKGTLGGNTDDLYGKIDVYYPDKKTSDVHLEITVYFSSMGNSSYIMEDSFWSDVKSLK